MTQPYPVEAKCPVCGELFQQPKRKQGGGRRTIYCSARCRSNDWARGNGASRTATITKYDSRPENKDAKRLRAKAQKFRKYGWTEQDFLQQLTRQNSSCYGCLTIITDLTACIDHDHKTGVVRGLLCASCNWGLGHLNDDALTLRRLMVHLDHDLIKTYVYTSGALKNPRVPEVGNLLRGAGFEVWDEWYGSGPHADIHWSDHQKQIGRTYPEALKGIAAQNTYMFDRAYIDFADYVVLIMPAGKSSFIELGYALGRGKPGLILLEEEPDRPDLMTNFADIVVTSVDALIERLN